MNTLNYIYTKIDKAKALDFGIIFNQAIELFKKTWIQGFVMQLLILVLMLPFLIVFYIPFILMIFAEAQNGYVDSNTYESFFAGFSILFLVLFIVGILVLSAVSVCLNAAFYRIIRDLDKGKEVKTNDFFYFLKGKYLSKAFVLILLSFLIAIVAMVLCYLPIFYVMVPMTFFTVVFAFNPELSATDIVKVSFKLGNKKWLISFGLMFVSGLLAQIVGMLLCGIGILFTSAFVYNPIYLIYKEVIGFDDEVESDTLVNFNE